MIPDTRSTSWLQRTLQLHAFVCLSHLYALTLLVGYWLLGHLEGRTLLAYGAWIVGGELLITWLYVSGRAQRFRDPGLFLLHQTASIGGVFGLLAWAPSVGFQCFVMLVVFCTDGFLAPDRRSYVLTWTVTALGAISAVLFQGPALAPPLDTMAERLLIAGALLGAFLRSVVLLVYFNTLQRKLADSRTRLTATMQQLEKLAWFDELTGIDNRRGILEWLAAQLALFGRGGSGVGVALLDVDHFKSINDRFGHQVGDRVLRELAQVVRAALRETDRLGRYGGEEFLLVMPAAGGADLDEPLERIRQAVAAHRWHEIEPQLRVTISLGGSAAIRGDSADSVIGRADQALYRAKREGRNCVRLAAEAVAVPA